MLSWIRRTAMACWRPLVRRYYAPMSKDDGDDDSSLSEKPGSGSSDPLLWSKDLEKHSCGEFSFAVVQANEAIEDYSQVETGQGATFVGVYDGHGGDEASKYVSDHLFINLMKLAKERGTMSQDILRYAVSMTEEGFLTLVRRTWIFKPLIAAMGSCCLVGVIWKGTVYLANLGDSRAVIGCLGTSKKIIAEPLTRDHNASREEVRRELLALHPDDSQIVVMKHGVWRVKGIIQVSRSIGDAFLKQAEFSLDRSFPRFHLSEPIRRPVLSSEPSVHSRVLQSDDKFLVFASDGLWEHLNNQQVVEIVYNNPRAGIAQRLVKEALNVAAVKKQMTYNDLKKVDCGSRRFFHDDISVVVLFIDHDLLGKTTQTPEKSTRGFVDIIGPSNFSIISQYTLFTSHS